VTCPEVFTLTDDGYSEVREPEIAPALEATVRTAAGNCPEHAIAVT
jgi:ferredoxin